MATNQNNGSREDVDALKRQNAALQEQVEILKAERDAYRKYVHLMAKQNITEEVVQGWMAEEKVEGSMIDFINEVKNEA